MLDLSDVTMAQKQDKGSGRYSKELLSAVQYFLSVDDPLSEANYEGGLNRITAEPSETLAIIRCNARAALYDLLNEKDIHIDAEDRLFFRVEHRIQQNNLRETQTKERGPISLTTHAGVVVAMAIVGLRSSDGIILGGLIFGGLLLFSGAIRTFWLFHERRRIGESLRQLSHAIGQIN